MAEKQYRTREQYEDMIENCINGNRTDAWKIGAEGWRYANDLIKEYEEWDLEDSTDLALLVECIWEARKDSF